MCPCSDKWTLYILHPSIRSALVLTKKKLFIAVACIVTCWDIASLTPKPPIIVFITCMRRRAKLANSTCSSILTNELSVTPQYCHVPILFLYLNNLGMRHTANVKITLKHRYNWTQKRGLVRKTSWWSFSTNHTSSTHLPCVGVGEFSGGVLRSTQHQHVITVGSQTGHHRSMAERS